MPRYRAAEQSIPPGKRTNGDPYLLRMLIPSKRGETHRADETNYAGRRSPTHTSLKPSEHTLGPATISNSAPGLWSLQKGRQSEKPMQPLRDRSSLDGLPRPRPLRRSRTSSWKSARSRSWSDKWPTTLPGCGNARRREISVGAGKVVRGSWLVGCSAYTASGGCSSCVSALYPLSKQSLGN